jgi:phospholipase/carboxylesterase
MHKKDIRSGGVALDKASRVLIMLHGRGAPAEDIMGLSRYLNVSNFALLAPQASNYTWYPYSFLMPPGENEPWLSSALQLLAEIVNDIEASGKKSDQIFIAGFSQGACLTLEFATRHARRWGGIVAFTGGLIGDHIYQDNYKGNFEGTPVFVGSSDPDPHVPVQRVKESVAILKAMGASVIEKICKNMGHTINEEEIRLANEFVFGANVN